VGGGEGTGASAARVASGAMYNPEVTRLLVIVLVGVFVVGLVAWLLLKSAVRRLGWDRERARRAGLQQAVATVERCDRITSVGDCDLVVSFETMASPSYREARQVRQRATMNLPGDTIERVTASGTIPIRFDPEAVLAAVIDFDRLLGADAGTFERDQYVYGGVRRWRAL
jgi:hypothetical protein